MTKELYKNLKYKDLEKLEEVKAEINEESFKVVEGICPNCNLKMEKFIENDLLWGLKPPSIPSREIQAKP